ncbi:MAG: hypothetical protein PHO83_03855 [Geobacteraceae bacterium]|nr:hypothetical protein [Geobacteraceae bacterium]
MANERIDAKYLKGLKFTTSVKKQVPGEAVKHAPAERRLGPADVLDWQDLGDTVIIVSADGRKHTVDKKAVEKA